jgi:hypothetical protein
MTYDAQDLEKLYKEIEHRYMPNRGWCDAPGCTACTRAHEQVKAAKDAARRGYYLSAPSRAQDTQIQRRIFEQGYERGHNEGLQQAHQWAAQKARQAAMAARNEWYQRGLREGRASAPTPPAPDNKALRKKYMDEVLDQCHIIAESNPQMKPGVNAVRHMVKKLR